jgi:hypothetical protein
MMPGMPKRRTHDHVRHGVTNLFAAFNIADGTVISSIHRRHRAIEFKKLPAKIDAEVPDDLHVHLVCDSYGTHKTPAINAWLAKHPRFHMHLTATSSSWINQVERWFGFITDELIRRGSHTSVQALEADIRAWAEGWNEDPNPSSGPNPPNRSSSQSDDFLHESPVRHTRRGSTDSMARPCPTGRKSTTFITAYEASGCYPACWA